MSHQRLRSERTIIERYTRQPGQLPAGLRRLIEQRWDGAQVQLYALADLDASMRLAQIWVALGPAHMAVARDAGGSWDIQSFERSRLRAARSAPGLSCTTVTLLGEPDQPALAVLRFSNRQRRAFENITFVLEEALEGRGAPEANPDEAYASGVAGPIRDAQALVAGNDAAVLWRLLSYLGPYRLRVAIGLSAAACITLLSLVPPYVAGHLIDEVVRPVQDGSRVAAEVMRAAWIAVSAIATVIILRQLFGFVRLRTMSVLGEFVVRDLRAELYEHLQGLSLAFFSRKRTGSIITRVSSDTDRLWEFLAFGVIDVSLSVVMLLGLGVVLISLDWQLGLVMVTPVPIVCLAIWWHGRTMNTLFTRAWRKWSRLNDVLSDTIPGMRVVKAFNQERRENERFAGRNRDATKVFNRIHHTWTTFWPALMLLVHGLTVVVWVLAMPRLLGTGASGLSAGTFVSFLLYMTMFVAPIEVIGQVARILNRATSSAHRIFEVLDTEPEIVDAREPVRLDPIRGDVEFDNVTFAYDGVRQVIRGVSFRVNAGEMIGLVGPSGGGKTTITNLIARFFDATGGAIRIDGVDLGQIESGHYRRQIGMVLQDPYLFHGTVLDNIRYGIPEASADRVVDAAQAANAHDFVCRLPHGYDTMVGERGHNLSGGERQRVSIARAILTDPRILILDEATSSVDTETEAKIQDAIDRLVRGRTVFAIAHRLSTLRRATRLFVIEDGQVTESGTHAELLEDPDSMYRTLHEMQLKVQHGV